MLKKIILIAFFIILPANLMALSHGKYCKLLITAFDDKSEKEFIKRYESEYVKICRLLKPVIVKENSETLLSANRQLKFLRILKRCDYSKHKGFIKFLLKNPEQWGAFVDQIKEEDKVDEVLTNLDELFLFDKANFKNYFNLMLAISVVWDVQRPNLHGQMGRETLAYEKNLVELYSYFRDLYNTTKAGIKYKELTVDDLVFVVNTPVPVSELRWAQKEVKGSAKSWGKKYGDIEYDTPRLAANEFSWPRYNGDYSLENIEEHGGICVDQAYFAVMTGRARGIPTMYFGGSGKRGGHAWLGLYKNKNEWDTEIGQYEGDNYAVGYANNPQTDRPLTDHELEFRCNRKFGMSNYKKSAAFVEATVNLYNLKQSRQAIVFADLIRKYAPLYTEIWDVKADYLQTKGDLDGLKSLYADKLKVFKRFNDVRADTEQKYAEVLSALGDEKRAQIIYKRSAKNLDGERIDLQWKTVQKQFRTLVASKDIKKALTVLEKFIYGNRSEIANVFSAMNEYINFCSKNKLEKECCKFIKKIYGRMEGDADDLVIAQLMALMIRAYENAGDERGVAKIKKELAKFTKDQEKQAARDKKKDKRRQIEDDDRDDYESNHTE